VGPDPSVNGPGSGTRPGVWVARVPPDLVPDQEGVEVIYVSFLHAQICVNISPSHDRLIG
jgi:hypothetical protein